jgi:hypothetical protein
LGVGRFLPSIMSGESTLFVAASEHVWVEERDE